MKRLLGGRNQRLVIIAVLVICLALAGIWRITHPAAAVVLSDSARSKLLFTPYLPHSIPKGYAFNPHSVTTKEGALFFALTSDKVSVTLSEQAVPKGYDLNTFYDASIVSPTRLHIKQGTAIFGQNYRQSGSIISYTTPDNTWVIVSSVGKLSQQTATQLISSLKPQD